MTCSDCLFQLYSLITIMLIFFLCFTSHFACSFVFINPGHNFRYTKVDSYVQPWINKYIQYRKNRNYETIDWKALAQVSESVQYLTIIPLARMGSESIAHEAKGRMGYRLRGNNEGERNNCFSKIQPVGQKYREQKYFSYLKLDFNHFLPRKTRRFSLLVGYNI